MVPQADNRAKDNTASFVIGIALMMIAATLVNIEGHLLSISNALQVIVDKQK